MSTKTAKSVGEVKDFVENRAHHHCWWDADDKFFNLAGHGYKLRVPVDLWRQCEVYAPGGFDTRMFRWGKGPAKELPQ